MSLLLLEDGSALLLEDGSDLLLETPVTPVTHGGGGRPIYFVPTWRVGSAHAELGRLDAHAEAVIIRVGVARSNTTIDAHAVATVFDVREDEDELLFLLS